MEHKAVLDIVKAMPLFTQFPEDELNSLIQRTGVVSYRKGEVIYLQGDESRSFDIILKGTVQIQQISENGSVLTVKEFHTGDTLGGNLLYASQNTYPMTVISRTAALILQLRKEYALDLCGRNRTFLTQFLKTVSNRSYELGTRLGEVTLKTIREKVMHYLFREYRRTGDRKIDIKKSRNEWARELGVERPSLSRELGKMRDQGLIEYEGSTVVLGKDAF